MLPEDRIGRNIRELRRAKGMTLEELAQRSGFTKGYLSKVENSDKAPPVSTLINIAEALGANIAELFGDESNGRSLSLVRRGERQTIARDGTVFGYAYETLARSNMHKHMEPYILTVPKEPKDLALFQHKGEEMLLVLQGTMRFLHGGEEYIVNEGDCVYFDSGVPHRGLSAGEGDLVCLMVIYVP